MAMGLTPGPKKLAAVPVVPHSTDATTRASAGDAARDGREERGTTNAPFP
jgi:hypothetical protein